MGAWIETHKILPPGYNTYVAPLVGAWIETTFFLANPGCFYVAPLVGAWIETRQTMGDDIILIVSHPSWVRGLKLTLSHISHTLTEVAPLVGAWIETVLKTVIMV